MTARRTGRAAAGPAKTAAPAKRPVRLLLVDDHEVVRLGLRTLLDQSRTITVVGEAGSVAAAVAEARRLKPDVVLMDVRLPDGSGIEACRAIRAERPETRLLFLTSFSDEAAVVSTMLAGAAGFLLKEVDVGALTRAIETVARGHSIFDPAAMERMLAKLRHQQKGAPAHPDDELSPRDQRILALVADGKTNKEIAGEIGLSDKTIKNLLSAIFQKLQISKRSQAAALFVKRATSQHTP